MGGCELTEECFEKTFVQNQEDILVQFHRVILYLSFLESYE